jgi:hypothetical protein
MRPLSRDGLALHEALLVPAEKPCAQAREAFPAIATVPDVNLPSVKAAVTPR